ncbi:unnamed protein product, partial [Prorocentrum cordatum]
HRSGSSTVLPAAPAPPRDPPGALATQPVPRELPTPAEVEQRLLRLLEAATSGGPVGEASLLAAYGSPQLSPTGQRAPSSWPCSPSGSQPGAWPEPAAAPHAGTAPPAAAPAEGGAGTGPGARQPGGSRPAACRGERFFEDALGEPEPQGGGGLRRALFQVQTQSPRACRRTSAHASPCAPGVAEKGTRRSSVASPWPTPVHGGSPQAAAGDRRSFSLKDETPSRRWSSVRPPSKSAHPSPEVLIEPSCSETISTRVKRMLSEDHLISVFNRFKKDGEVHKDSLSSALTFLGFHPVVERINEVAEEVSIYATVDLREFCNIVQLYLERRLIDQRLAFHGADEDRSGKLDMQEISALLLQLGMKPMDFVIKGIFEEVDEDRDGAIDADEFDEFWRIMESRAGFCRVEYNRLMGAFDTFDCDHSGTLDLEETSRMLHYLNYTLSSDEAQDIFRSVDVSNLGHLCKHEFLLFMRRTREHEVGKISECLVNVFDYTKERTLTKLLVTLGHVPNRNAVIECAEDAGIDLTDDTASSNRVDHREATELVPRRAFGSRALRLSSVSFLLPREAQEPDVGHGLGATPQEQAAQQHQQDDDPDTERACAGCRSGAGGQRRRGVAVPGAVPLPRGPDPRGAARGPGGIRARDGRRG